MTTRAGLIAPRVLVSVALIGALAVVAWLLWPPTVEPDSQPTPRVAIAQIARPITVVPDETVEISIDVTVVRVQVEIKLAGVQQDSIGPIDLLRPGDAWRRNNIERGGASRRAHARQVRIGQTVSVLPGRYHAHLTNPDASLLERLASTAPSGLGICDSVSVATSGGEQTIPLEFRPHTDGDDR